MVSPVSGFPRSSNRGVIGACRLDTSRLEQRFPFHGYQTVESLKSDLSGNWDIGGEDTFHGYQAVESLKQKVGKR